MQGDPQRPYAQLLTPAAKSQKLLLRLQHKKLSSPEQTLRAQRVFRAWQALLQKNIPSTPWPSFADLVMFLDGRYIPVLIAPFCQLEVVQLAFHERSIDGYVLLDDESSPLSVTPAGDVVIGLQMADRLGRSAWLTAARPLTDWQSALVMYVAPNDSDTALDLLRLLASERDRPWPSAHLTIPEQLLAEVYFRLRRAQGGAVTIARLGSHPLVVDAAEFLHINVPGVRKEGDYYRFLE